MTGIGDLNRRLGLEAPVEADDGAGGVTRTYTSVATLWAQLTPLSAQADIAAASVGAIVTHRIVIRAGRDLTTLHRFRDGLRVFRVVSFREGAERGFIKIEAQESEH
ncbi:MAG: phage head closure protein [Pseudolabrys sp.]